VQLIQHLEAARAAETSVFRAQLLKEDIARLRALLDLARAADTAEAFAQRGFLVGWTPGDTRTFELRPALEPLLAAFYAACSGDAGAEQRLVAAWQEFDRLRMDRLVGRLSRVPPPSQPD
jgi:hypothetical protein